MDVDGWTPERPPNVRADTATRDDPFVTRAAILPAVGNEEVSAMPATERKTSSPVDRSLVESWTPIRPGLRPQAAVVLKRMRRTLSKRKHVRVGTTGDRGTNFVCPLIPSRRIGSVFATAAPAQADGHRVIHGARTQASAVVERVDKGGHYRAAATARNDATDTRDFAMSSGGRNWDPR